MAAVDPECPYPCVASSLRGSVASSPFLHPSLCILLLFLSLLPTLTWLEFSSGSENLNVATAMEIRRSGQWLIPTLAGQPRIAKPPLTAWITAGLLRESTLQSTLSPDSVVRDDAYRDLLWQVRFPILILSCIAVVAVFQLARIYTRPDLALLTALIFCTNYAALRFFRTASTDVHLAFWVLIANLAFADALLFGRYWRGFLAAGIATGLAFMSKGPVALVQTITPVAIFAIVDSILHRDKRPPLKEWLVPALGGLVLMLLVAAPWFILVLQRHDAWTLWFREVTREGATDLPRSDPFNYLSLFPMMLPWIVFFIAGLLIAVVQGWQFRRRPEARPLIFTLYLLIIPILIMTCFRDRKERYLLPMIAPASILAALGFLSCLGRDILTGSIPAIPPKLRPILLIIHIAILFAMVQFPLVGTRRIFDDAPWLTPRFALVTWAAGLLTLIAGVLLSRRRPFGLAWTTFLLMLLFQAIFMWGYRDTDEGRSEMRPMAGIIRRQFPSLDAEFLSFFPGRRAPEDLSIYLNHTVHPIADMSDIVRTSRNQILVIHQRQNQPLAEPPSGFLPLGNVRRGKNFWHAFYRSPDQRPLPLPASLPASR